ncbi:hypothetical protein BU23DRAFT_510998 [Bimuria novae-zelandiae CBS 107.79]|uniref:Uncharacterized protein n=1 Tax=Bimuria novae-zelandiae CBS 107.79 TaxID=1447943 RepID=A0A6A5V119_9PLEO|nr:hypothetical protein BU23DRAFT_510998 [Bimuria novae-zelandiae CBS 107.79]
MLSLLRSSVRTLASLSICSARRSTTVVLLSSRPPSSSEHVSVRQKSNTKRSRRD